MPAEGNLPLVGFNDVIGPEHFDTDQLIKRRLKCLHQARKILRGTENAQMLDRQLAGIHQDHVGLFERYSQEPVQVFARNSVQFHVAPGIEDSEEPAIHRLDQFIGPGYRAYTAAAVTIEGKAGFLKYVQPLHFFVAIRRGQVRETVAV